MAAGVAAVVCNPQLAAELILLVSLAVGVGFIAVGVRDWRWAVRYMEHARRLGQRAEAHLRDVQRATGQPVDTQKDDDGNDHIGP